MSLTSLQHCILDTDEVVYGEAAVRCWRSSDVLHVSEWSNEYMSCL